MSVNLTSLALNKGGWQARARINNMDIRANQIRRINIILNRHNYYYNFSDSYLTNIWVDKETYDNDMKENMYLMGQLCGLVVKNNKTAS